MMNMDAMPIKGSNEILPTEGSAHMITLMDRIETVAKFSPMISARTEYVGKRRAA